MADKAVTDKLQRRVARVLVEMAQLRAKRLAARLRLARRSSTTPTAKGPQCPRCTILTEDGGLFYVEADRGSPVGYGRNERWFFSASDMAQALSRERIDEIHASLSMQSIEALITWQMDEEIQRNRGQIVRGDVGTVEEDDGNPDEVGFVVFGDDGDDDDF